MKNNLKNNQAYTTATYITASWDDGHKLDIRLAALHRKYGIKATFYIAPHNREIPAENLLSDTQVAELSKDFEIGAHTMTHPQLPLVSDEVARGEIADSKTYLEKVTGKPVTTFCYPRGQYTRAHVDMVKAAGYSYARTINRYSLSASPLLQSPTSVHTYDHWSYILPTLKVARYNPITFARLYRRWDKQAIYLFDRAMKEGGVFHLWGHSWEIENNDDWQRLEAVFKYIAHRDGARYVTNGELAAQPAHNQP